MGPEPIVFHIDAWATKLGLRNVDIARRAGITPGYVSSLRNGRKATLSPATEQNIAVLAFGIPALALRFHPDSKEAQILLAMRNVSDEDLPATLRMLEGVSKKKA